MDWDQPLPARFVKGSTTLAQLPPPDRPEFAFIGRSNVGKSSLLNMLVRHNGLAKVSATPGKTREINHFAIGDAWYLVDLPGYGYAKVSKAERERFETMIWDYLRRRESLVTLFLLVDARHEPLANDLAFVDRLGQARVPFALVLTKADKLGTQQQRQSLARWDRELRRTWDPLPPRFLTSAETSYGRALVLEYIAGLVHQS